MRGFPHLKELEAGVRHDEVTVLLLGAYAAAVEDTEVSRGSVVKIRGPMLRSNLTLVSGNYTIVLLCNRIIVPQTIVTQFDYTCSFPLSSEAAPVAQLQTPVIKLPVILYSGLLTQGAQVSEINFSCNTRMCG